jgi:hypothetical protein
MSGSTVPNSTKSSPVKLDVTATRWFDKDTTSRSAAAGVIPLTIAPIKTVGPSHRIVNP